jgi:hypothetical protein
MAKGATDLAKAKAKKQKKIAIAGGVLFLALLAYQVPKTMKMLNQKPVAAATTPAPATTPTPTPEPGGTPTPGITPTTPAPTTGTAAASAADAIVVNADLAPAPLDGQLVSLTRFSSKDPFAPQNQVTEVVPPSSTPPGTTPGKTPAPTTPGDGGGGAFTPAPGTSPPGGSTAPSPELGTISINTVAMAVTVKTDFPADAPMFTLVSLTAKAAKIAIAGGSLASGTKTVTLPLGKPVTLMNTADGTRFVLVYVGPGDKTTPAAPASGGTTTTGSTTTTPAAGTSTPTGRG